MGQALIARARKLTVSQLRRGNLSATLLVESATGTHTVPLSATPISLWRSLAAKTVCRLNGTAVLLACPVENLPGMPDSIMLLHGEAGSRSASFLPYRLDDNGAHPGPGWVTFHEHQQIEHLLDGVVGGAEA